MNPPPPAAVSVLVVDDNREGAQLLCEWLDLEGYVAAAAFDGGSALELLAKRAYDVLLIDLQMPGMSGTQLAARLRATLRPAPVLVALTGYSLDEVKLNDADNPFDHFLRKPVEFDLLGALLRSVKR